MSDVVLTLPVLAGEESQLFGKFLNRFVEGCVQEAERWAAQAASPYIMVRSDPALDGRELKVVTFQESGAASAFATGWAKLRGAATALALG